MEYYAHKTDSSNQTVKAHLEGVAEKAKEYSIESLKDIAYYIGLAHDIGKYSKAFQARLNGCNVKFEHSACGALETQKLSDESIIDIVYMLLYCIAGHHTGLPDGDRGRDLTEDNTLQSKLKRAESYKGDSDYSAYKNEIKLQLPDFSGLISELSSSSDGTDFLEKYAFFTRYLFSCLTGSADMYTSELRSQRAGMILKDVKYGIEFHFELTGEKSDHDDECAEKHYNIMLRRLRNGQCFRQPCFGCREFSVNRIELVDEFDLSQVSEELKGDIDLGFMLYGMRFKDDGKPVNGNWDEPVFSDLADPMYYRPHMIDGVIDVEKYREGIIC